MTTSPRLGAITVAALLSAFATSAALAQDPWSDPASWPGGSVPGDGDLVVIPAGTDIVLDVDSADLAGLDIQGTLTFAAIDGLELTSDWIRVMGDGAALTVGTPDDPHPVRATITLTGTDESENVFGSPPMDSGTKFLMAMMGGTIDLHGASRDKVAWTLLDGSVPRGASELQLVDAVDWAVGDTIALAPTGFLPEEAEALVVTSVSSDGRTIGVGPWLQFAHYGEVYESDGRTIDMRAEVGLLTRNVIVRGGDASGISNFGGHMMIMPGGIGRLSGVLLHRMGQEGHPARYPFHTHLVDRMAAMGVTGADSWVRDCSIWHSFQRGVVIHGTSGVTIERVVTYDVLNHAFVPAEDGDEFDNVFRDNLAIKTLEPSEFAFPDPDFENRSLQREHRTSGFWLRNPNQVITGNRVAGTREGSGFLFDGTVIPEYREEADPVRVVFEDNLAHTNWSDQPDPHPYHESVSGVGLLSRDITDGVHDGLFHVQRFQTYMNGGPGVWLDGGNELATDIVIAESHSGFATEDCTVRGALVIGDTPNETGSMSHERIGLAWRHRTGRSHDFTDVVFRNLDVGVLASLDFTLDDGVQIGDIEFRGSVTHRMRIDTDDCVGSFFDRDGTLTATGDSLLLSRYPIVASSEPMADAVDVWQTPIADVPNEKRIRVVSPKDGDTVGQDIDVVYQIWNHVPAPEGEALRVLVNGDATTIRDPGPFTIETLSPGWNRVEILLVHDDGTIDEVRERFNVFLPDLVACPADVSGNGEVGLEDLLSVLALWGQTVPVYTAGDADGNGFVDLNDLLVVLASFGESCPGAP